MLRHHLTSIFRNFKKFKSVFFINLIGLSAGLSCVLLIYIWVNDEINIDKFHENDAQLYQVMSNLDLSDNIETSTETPALLAETIVQEIPDIKYSAAVTPTTWFEPFTLSVEDDNVKGVGQFASPDYFNIFSYNLIQGDKSQVLKDKNSIVISKDLAMRLFKTTDNVVGKEVMFQREVPFLVSGVFDNIPSNSSSQFDFVLSFEKFKEMFGMSMEWTISGPSTYVVLQKGTNVDQFNDKIADFVKNKSEAASFQTLFVRPYSKGYLYGKYENGVQVGGRIEYVKLFSLIAIFIIVIACINFMNLSTAKAARRAIDVGIKKALGANQRSLVFQYLGESLLMTFLSLFVAIVVVSLLLPGFNEITGKQLSLTFDMNLILSIIGITTLTGIIAGSYPAFYLSSFNPTTVLKGKLNRSVGEMWARKGLVVFQFAISVILIVSVLIIYKQMEYVQQKNLGYDRDNVIYFEREGRVKSNLDGFLTQLKQVPGVINASSIGGTLSAGYGTNSGLQWEGKNPEEIIPFEIQPVNYDMIQMLGIQLKQGKLFSRASGADNKMFIFNEAAIDVMGIKDPIGKTVRIWDSDFEIGGIVKNFNFKSLHENVKPLIFTFSPDETKIIMVKLKAGMQKETLSTLQRLYSEYNPGFVFDYSFLDQDYQAQYASETRVSVLSRYFAMIAILISCLGLFGLASFTAEKRLKEIGIRKALGSSNSSIALLLSKEFTIIVVVSILIALPLSYFLMEKWLNGFAYTISTMLEIWYFLGAGLMALVISWLTVGIQAIKAAQISPIKCLKSE